MKIKNEYAEKYGKHKKEIVEGAILTGAGETFKDGFVNELGVDLVDGVKRQYIIVKMYKEEK